MIAKYFERPCRLAVLLACLGALALAATLAATPALATVVTVTPTGTGTGTVISTPAGINCSTIGGGPPGPVCSHDFAMGTQVTLQATGGGGAYFAGWTGDAQTGTCQSSTALSCTALAFFFPLTISSRFELLPDPPVPGADDALNVTQFSAYLRGRVNPNGAAIVSCRFEYGETLDYGRSAPCHQLQAEIGSGTGEVPVTAHPADLGHDSEYHFRLIVENAFGERRASEPVTFRTTPAGEGLGPQRSWELVTPSPTGGRDIYRGLPSTDGARVFFLINPYSLYLPGYDRQHRSFIATRGGRQWDTVPADSPNPADAIDDIKTYFESTPTPDMDQVLIQTTVGHDPDDQNGALDLYLRAPDGRLTWISRSALLERGEAQTDDAPVELEGRPRVSAFSADGRTVVFRSQRRLIADDPTPSVSGLPGLSSARLYKWSRGELTLLSRLPDGGVAVGGPVRLGGSALAGGNAVTSERAVSPDGTAVIWGDGTNTYLSTDGAATSLIGPGVFKGAASEAGLVFTQAGGHLYASSLHSTTQHDLTGPAGVLGVAAVAESGLRVYFVATAVLTPNPSPIGRIAADGDRNLYLLELSESGEPLQTKFISALDPSPSTAPPVSTDASNWTNAFEDKTASTTPSGSHLAFGSVRGLTGEATGGQRQLYVYDATASTLMCASCPRDGTVPAAGHVNAETMGNGGDTEAATTGGWSSITGHTNLLTDGGTVAFSTATALTKGDKNDVRDVYEFNSGELRLVSRGRFDDNPTQVVGASEDGNSVFFMTRETLDPRDHEYGVRKLYSARVGGGFPLGDSPSECLSDDCQGPISLPPGAPSVGSISFTGDGNARPEAVRASTSVRVARLGPAAGAVTRLRVRVPAAGRITVAGSHVRRAGRSVSRPGAYSVRIALRPAARKHLRTGTRKRVRSDLRIRFRARDGGAATKVASIVFRQKAKRGKAKRGER